MSNLSRLPGPFSAVWDWQRSGACRGRDSAQFFHPDGERGVSRTRRETAAKAVCRACPVRAECATHALIAREPYGVWGGFTEAERLRLLAMGWRDLIDHRHGVVDVVRLEIHLGVRRLPPKNIAPPQRGLAPTHPSSSPRTGAPNRPPAPNRTVTPNQTATPNRSARPPKTSSTVPVPVPVPVRLR